ncbi:MAG TPA: N-methyl-L-tryptophan oxidase [Acidimicrobiia bacterium]|nr:N-methyl-L-tryptophan oxidase [Acidimicrobiia bacterium]
MHTSDVLVVGLGAMGSAAAYQLSKTGTKVVGIDQYTPPHTFGSTHGDSRITRQATGEGAEYVPLVLRSQQLWREIEAETNTDLFTSCGVLVMSPSAGKTEQHGLEDFFVSTVELAESFHIEHEVFGSEEIRHRYPQFNVDDDYRVYLEPGGGFVRPEAAVSAQLSLAERNGAVLQYNEKVLDIAPDGRGVRVTTDTDIYLAQKVVVTAGPWITELFPESTLGSLFQVYRQVLHWFPIDPVKADSFTPEHLPVYVWTFGDQQSEYFYGFPAIDGSDGGVKVATGLFHETTTPENVQREVSDEETQEMYDYYIRNRMPSLAPQALRSTTCLYTETPDSHFVIDEHPQCENILLVSPCSGHGFKHSAAIGEAVAQRVLEGQADIDLSAFRLDRFI